MKRIIRFTVTFVHTILSLCSAAVLAADAADAAYRPTGYASMRTRNLFMEEASIVLYSIDFNDLATRNVTGGNLQFKESKLRGALPLHPKTQQVQYGAYDLSAEMVSDLNTMVVEQLKEVPPEQSQVLGPIQFPGTQMDGQSVVQTEGTEQPLRIPTIYAPFQSGTVFDFGPNVRGEGPGVALHLSNITLVLPNVTFSGLHTSGFTNFFKFRENARVCITNSMLVFKSCEGFLENTFHMLCCTESNCGIQYSKDALTHLGYHEVASTLGYLTCHDRRPRPALPVEAPPEGKKPNVTLISAVTVVVGVVLFCAVMTALIMRCTSKKSAGSLLPLTKGPVPASMAVTEQQSAPTKRDKRAPPPKASALTEKALKEDKHDEIVRSQTTASHSPEGHSGGLPPKLLHATRATSSLKLEESPVRTSNMSRNDLERGSDLERGRSRKGGGREQLRPQKRGMSPTRGRSPNANRHGVSTSRGASPAARPHERKASPRHRGASPEHLHVQLETTRRMLSELVGRSHEARSGRVGCSKGSAGARKSRSSMGSGKTASVPEGQGSKHSSAPLGVQMDSLEVAGDSQLVLLDHAGAASDFVRRPQSPRAKHTNAGEVHRPKTVNSRPNCVAPLPAAGSSLDEKRAAAERQLDALGAGTIVLDRFVLLDAGERVHGGQAVVQFAYGKLDKQDYAIKFFLSRKAFEAEEALYRHTTLGQFLPHVNASCPEAACSIRDPSGRPLPSCMVMERGEALDIWMERAQPDKYMAFSMIANLAERVCDLHARGWVHRDLKPGNVMWLPRTNRWTVIDFGCAAPCGILAPLSFTLGYAPPEVAIAIAEGRENIKSHFSMDAWSVGVIAFELLTGQSAFRMFQGKEDVRSVILACVHDYAPVMNQLVGTADLPWEGKRLTPEVLRKLGAHRKDVLGLLHRDPDQRLTLYEFLNCCSRVLQYTAVPGS